MSEGTIGKKYCIVRSIFETDFVRMIDEMIDNGWVPIGGPWTNGKYIQQAMINVSHDHIEKVIKEAFADDLSALDPNSRA